MPQDHEVKHAHPDPATLPPRDPTQSLLTHLMTDTMDEDYAHVAQRRADSAASQTDGGATRSRVPVGLMLVLILFGGLVVTAAVQTAQNRPEAQRERDQLVSEIHARSASVDRLRTETSTLQQALARLQSAAIETSDQRQALAGRIERLGISAGTVPVTGPGVEVVVDDASNASSDGGKVLDVDLQTLVNGLWESGAEAVAINGHRLSSLTAIRGAGEAITVDFRALAPPYVIDAIGNSDTLPARFLDTQAGQTWLDLQANFGMRFDMSPKDDLTLPADPGVALSFASAAKGPR
jgi:uncharacterized protein YlxW (UPF0749 family)